MKIKFKFWFPDTKKMSIAYTLDELLDGGWYDIPKHITLQYTGLKDKKGKEIYEGDIVNLNHWNSSDLFDYSKPFIVKWEHGQVNFKQGNFNYFIGGLVGKLDIKIIGNIYENSKLIN